MIVYINTNVTETKKRLLGRGFIDTFVTLNEREIGRGVVRMSFKNTEKVNNSTCVLLKESSGDTVGTWVGR